MTETFPAVWAEVPITEQLEKEKSSYSVLSIEDFMKRSENPYLGVVKADESNCSDKALT